MSDVGEGKCGAVRYGSLTVSDRTGKTCMNDTSEKQFFSDWAKGHSRECHDCKKEGFVLLVDDFWNLIGLPNIGIPVGIGIAIERIPDQIKQDTGEESAEKRYRKQPVFSRPCYSDGPSTIFTKKTKGTME